MPVESSQLRQESSPAPTLTEQFSTAAASARNSNAVHEVIRQVWRANAEGLVTDDDAQRIAEEASTRRASLAARTAFPAPPIARPKPKRHCRSPDREKSRLRARMLAAGRYAPATIAQHFTTTENAALAIVCQEIRAKQACTLPIDAIAARSGGSRTTVKRMFREADRLGLLDIKERRIPGRKSDTNVIRAQALELKAWLHWESIGVQKRTTTETPIKTLSASLTKAAPKAPSITLEKPFGELTRQERADLLRRTIGKIVA